MFGLRKRDTVSVNTKFLTGTLGAWHFHPLRQWWEATELASGRWEGVQLGERKVMFLCHFQVEICSMLLDVTLKLREVFGADIVDLRVISLQIVFGTIKVGELTQEQQEMLASHHCLGMVVRGEGNKEHKRMECDRNGDDGEL